MGEGVPWIHVEPPFANIVPEISNSVTSGPTARTLRSRPPQSGAKRKNSASSVPGVEPNVPQPLRTAATVPSRPHMKHGNPAHLGRGTIRRGSAFDFNDVRELAVIS